ncbi:MAG: hypothetical protein ABGX47_07490 [Martelella sp.]|uniref:hypothetical protein n=1 Tax=Martelella sp. TaxID=1969699 RepID=UPI003241FDF1
MPELAEVYRRIAIQPVLRLLGIYADRAYRRGETHSAALHQQPILIVAPMLAGAMWNNAFAQGEPIDIAGLFEAYLELVFDTSTSAP